MHQLAANLGHQQQQYSLADEEKEVRKATEESQPQPEPSKEQQLKKAFDTLAASWSICFKQCHRVPTKHRALQDKDTGRRVNTLAQRQATLGLESQQKTVGLEPYKI